MNKYALSSAIIILGEGFTGWAVMALSGGSNAMQSTGTGWGAGIGVAVAIGYYFATRPANLNGKAKQ